MCLGTKRSPTINLNLTSGAPSDFSLCLYSFQVKRRMENKRRTRSALRREEEEKERVETLRVEEEKRKERAKLDVTVKVDKLIEAEDLGNTHTQFEGVMEELT